MAIKPFKRNSNYIPRKSYNAREVRKNKESGSIFENDTDDTTPFLYTSFTVKQCTIQATKGQDLLTLDEGFRDQEVYTLFTETPITSVIESTNRLGDQIEYDGVNGTSWFTVIKVKKWNVGVAPHYMAIIVKDPDD